MLDVWILTGSVSLILSLLTILPAIYTNGGLAGFICGTESLLFTLPSSLPLVTEEFHAQEAFEKGMYLLYMATLTLT